jgi:hypothetical protein
VHLGPRFGTRRCDNCRDWYFVWRRRPNAASWYCGHDTQPGSATCTTETYGAGYHRAYARPSTYRAYAHPGYITANSNGTEFRSRIRHDPA